MAVPQGAVRPLTSDVRSGDDRHACYAAPPPPPWRDEDLAPFTALNADPRVMAHFPGTLGRVESHAMVARIRDHFIARGFGRWAVEVPGTAAFIGAVGLSVPAFEAHITPCVEVSWRLAFDHWGRGYATEAASAAIAYGFGPLGLRELVAFTVPENTGSRRVMERLGMTHAPADDFAHPNLPEGHPLRRHVLYRLSRSDWRAPHPG